MTTKKELIAIAEQNNIFYRASWKKDQIAAAVKSDIKFGDLVTVRCKRSGISFQVAVEDRRAENLHPKVAFYTQHKDLDVRYPAIQVIESKEWESWENLEKAIQVAIKPPEWDFQGHWVAQITGSDKDYRFKRRFLGRVDQDKRFNLFNISKEIDGYYEACYLSVKGNETRYYYKVNGGNLIEVEKQEVENQFPEIEKEDFVAEGCQEIEGFVAKEESLTYYNDQLVYIVRVEMTGIKTDHEWNDELDEWEETSEGIWKSWIRPATEKETKTYLAQEVAKKEKLAAIAKLNKVYESIKSPQSGDIKPSNTSYPKGKEFVVQQGAFQANQILVLQGDCLWLLTYNNRDGDDWRFSNVDNAYIGHYRILDRQEQKRIEELLNCVN